MNQHVEKPCEECGAPVYGRSDKKFCSDQCRTSFHNRENSDASNFMRNVNGILRKNRKILFELNPDGKMKLHRDRLVKKGFNFNFFTNIYETKAGKRYFFVYDQGYVSIENEYYTLVHRQEYIDK